MKHTDKRPDRPWVMTQVLQDVFFMNWSVDPVKIASLLPKDLVLDLYEGSAWISIVPFRVVRMRMRGLPPFPGLNKYLELNVRTYVTKHGVPGIYFLKIHTNLLPVTFGARAVMGLPYIRKNLTYTVDKNNYHFNEKHFRAAFTINSEKIPTEKGPLYSWLLERYSMFVERGKRLYRGDIHHLPWDVWEAAGILEQNTIFPYIPQEQPLTFYTSQKQMLIYPLVRVE